MHHLNSLFQPSSLVLYGAREETTHIGGRLLHNLLAGGYRGALHVIDPKRSHVQGVTTAPSLDQVQKPVDLALIAASTQHAPDILDELGSHGITMAVILSDTPRESSAEERELERRACEAAIKHGIRFVGPNALGVVNPRAHLNASYSLSYASPGNLALVSQSGALCSAILDWAHSNAVGFSYVISPGMQADIDVGEILDFLISDAHTRSILLYLEGIGNARRFMSALRAASRAKPVIVLKSGRFEASSKLAISHAGAMIGNDDVFDCALARAGVVRIDDSTNMFAAARTLSVGMHTRGRRLALVTNGVGPGRLAWDRIQAHDLPLTTLQPETVTSLRQQRNIGHDDNPVHLSPETSPDQFAEVVEACLRDKNVDAVLAILIPHALIDAMAVADKLIALAKKTRKPLLTCWMGEEQVETSRDAFKTAKVPTFHTPETAVEGFFYLAKHSENQELLLQVPDPLGKTAPPDVERARVIVDQALASGRTLLNEFESKQILSAYHIPTSTPKFAMGIEQAVAAAEAIGYPVVLKVHSPDIVHKIDSGGVRLNIVDTEELRPAYEGMLATVKARQPQARIQGVLVEAMHRPGGRELAVGVIHDPLFGPAISFGSGGTMIEIFKDQAVALPPLNNFLAKKMIERTRASNTLGEFRGMPAADVSAIENILLRVSEMVCTLPALREMDLNPIIVDPEGLAVLDARMSVVAYDSSRRYAHMAIHPYPNEQVHMWTAKNGIPVTIRPIRPEDAVIERRFLEGLSGESRYFRFMNAVPKFSAEMISDFTRIDYDRDVALIAVLEEIDSDRQIGVARFSTKVDEKTCEFAIVIADEWRGQGLAAKLMRDLIGIARQKGLESMIGVVLRNNSYMATLMEHLGFRVERTPDDLQTVAFTLDLTKKSASVASG